LHGAAASIAASLGRTPWRSGQGDGGIDRTLQRAKLRVIVAGITKDLDMEAFAVLRLIARAPRRGHQVSAAMPAAASVTNMPEILARRSDGRQVTQHAQRRPARSRR